MTPAMQDQIAVFFTDPFTAPPVSGSVSTLYLLRREIQDCLIGTVVEETALLAQPQRHRLFATAMVVFAGIDLLAKFAATNASLGMSERFVGFLTTYGVSDEEGSLLTVAEAQAIADYRHALMHSFGLYHETKGGQVVPLLLVDTPRQRPVVTTDGEALSLSVDDLVAMFLTAIGNYRADLDQSVPLQIAFAAAFRRYGTLHMESAPHIAPRGERLS